MAEKDCIFCKIFAGQLPTHDVYSDEDAKAFLDINPVSRGHVLVIPAQHIGEFYELGSESYSHLMSVVQRLARDMKRRLGAQRINIKTIGEHVPDHTHLHLIPVYPEVASPSPTDEKELSEIAQLISS